MSDTPINADPFNCPDCGSHDYGLYAPVFGACPHCMKRENADLRAEIKAHNDGCAAACKARHEGGACAYRNADGSSRYGNKRCHDCPQEYAIDAAIAQGKV